MNPMTEPTLAVLAESSEEDPARVKRLSELLSFWLGVGEGATSRAEAAEARVAELQAEVVRLRLLPGQIANAMVEAANIDRARNDHDHR
jgi:hypothetical protein